MSAIGIRANYPVHLLACKLIARRGAHSGLAEMSAMRTTPLSVKIPAGSAAVAGADDVDRVDCVKVESGEYLAVRRDVVDRKDEALVAGGSPPDGRIQLIEQTLAEELRRAPFWSPAHHLRGSIRSAARPKSRLNIPWNGFFDGHVLSEGWPIGRCRIQ